MAVLSRPVAAVELGTIRKDVRYSVGEEWIGLTCCAGSGKMER